MDSIVTAVLKATFGMLVKRGINMVARKLKDGDVTDQNIRALIVSEIENINSKLNALSRKELLASISFFKEGMKLLYEVFEKARSRSENGVVTTQAACTEAFSLAKAIRKLNLTDLDESATRKLADAKKRFKDARKEATRAFNVEALEISDRILAMQYRAMATILEKVDNPADALGTLRVCIEELHGLSAIKQSFNVELGKGLRARFAKAERRKIISNVCHVNSVIYVVTLMVCTCFGNEELSNWPCIGSGEDKVDPLRDGRVTEVLREQGMEHCCVTPWSFGQEGEQEHKLKCPESIATNSSAQFIVGDRWDSNVKVFDSSGTFTNPLSLPNDEVDTNLLVDVVDVVDVAADINDNVYVLVKLEKPGKHGALYEFNNTADLHHKFPVWRVGDWDRLAVTDSGKVLLLRTHSNVVDVYETDGHLVTLVGKDILRHAFDIAAANGGRVMVGDNIDYHPDISHVHIFSEHGDHLNAFKLQGRYSSPKIAFHRASEHAVFAGLERKKDLLHVEIYTKDGEFVRSTQIHEERIADLEGMAVTTEGRIAVVCRYNSNLPSKVLVI